MREVTARAFRIGLASVRANAVPTAALWLLAIALAGACFRLPAFAGLLGVASDINFHAMSAVFGDGIDLATLVKKTLVDQLAWTVLFVVPNLVSNWCVWTPVQFVLFMFPLDLQIHMGGLVCAFWTLMCLRIGKRT